MPANTLLAAADLLSHVLDAPLFEGLLWEPGSGSTLEKVCRDLSKIGLGKHTLLFFAAGALTLLFFWSYARRAGESPVPGRWGNLVETLLEFIRDEMIRPFLGPAGDKYLPLIASFFVYVLIANLLGLVPFLDWLGHGGNTATASLYITAALALCSFSLYHGIGIREQGGFRRYVKNLFPHVPAFVIPIIIPVEIIAHIVRPCALAIRLFANMLAGHTLMAAILGFTAHLTRDNLALGGPVTLVSVLAVVGLSFLEILVALIQAFVFAFLTTVFLSMAVHPEH